MEERAFPRPNEIHYYSNRHLLMQSRCQVFCCRVQYVIILAYIAPSVCASRCRFSIIVMSNGRDQDSALPSFKSVIDGADAKNTKAPIS